MTVIDTKEPVERHAGERPASERAEHDEPQGAGPAKTADERAREKDPFALDPLGPPSGRPW